MSRRPLDVTGRTFGRLTALRPTARRAGSSIVWECRCACGALAKVSLNLLRQGRTRSCGCLFLERVHHQHQTPRRQQAVNLRAAGWPVTQIAQMLGVSKQRVSQLLRPKETT